MTKKYLLGFDAGTSLVKAVVFDFAGTEIGSGSRKVAVDTPSPLWAQQSPDLVWLATAHAIKQAIEQASISGNEIAVVGPSGQGDGAWMIDKTGAPLSPTPLWNDGRASNVVSNWEGAGILEQIYTINGTQLWPGSAAPILAWMKKHNPERFSTVSTLFCSKDWIKYKLTGTVTTDESDGSIPFLNLADRSYDDRLLELTGLQEMKPKLAKIVPSHEVVGEVTAQAALETGLCQGTPVVSGMLDVAANAIGAGVIEAGQALSILGTTSMNMVVLDSAATEPMGIGATTCHGVSGKWMRILGAMTGTPNLDWYINAMGTSLKKKAEAQNLDLFLLLEEAVDQSPIGSQGVIFHPFLLGERAPFVNSSARAGFFGIHANTTENDLLRAIYEGIALSSRDCYEKVGADLNEITLVGGGSRSRIWCQTLADAVGCKMQVPSGTQFGALGAAIAGGVGIGVYDDYNSALEQCLKIEQVYEPSSKNSRKYDDLYRLYADLISRMEHYWDDNQRMLDSWKDQEHES
jgi:sugar (pentulose or hexulose) kinase